MVVNTLKEWQPACPKGEAKLIFPNGKGAVDSLPNMHRRGLGALQVACAIATDLRRRRDRIRYVGVRHEEAAAFMASGYTKHNGRLGICVGTTGPGAIHLLNGLYDACFDGAPLVALTATTSISGLVKPTQWSPTSRPPG